MKKILLGFLFGGMIFSALCGAKIMDNRFLPGGRPLLIPDVQRVSWQEKSFFEIPETFTVLAPAEAANEVALLKESLEYHFPGRKMVAVSSGNAVCRLQLKSGKSAGPAEGYTLAVTPDGIDITAATLKGLYYGVQTLDDLWGDCRDGRVPACVIEDYPDLQMRGVFFVLRRLANRDVPEFCRVIDALGRLKLNTLVLEFAENLPMQNSPFTARKMEVLTEKSVEAIKAAARRNHMEIIPHLQAVTHEEWLRSHPDYGDKITASKTAFKSGSWNTSYCPAKPLGREVTAYTIRETVRLLGVKRFHLALDEFGTCQWGRCDLCKGGHTTGQLVDEVLFYENLVYSLGVTPIIYHDPFVPGRVERGETVLEKLRKETIVNIWDYRGKPAEDTWRYFQKNGFNNLYGASFCNVLENTRSLAAMNIKCGGMGVILTYWGYVGTPFTDPVRITSRAAAGTVLTGYYAWKNASPEYLALSWDPAFELRRRMRADAAGKIAGEYAPLPLGKAFNVRLGRNSAYPMLSAGEAAAVKSALAQVPEKFVFDTNSAGEYSALLLKDGDAPVAIPVGSRVGKLSFLLTSGRSADTSLFDGKREHRVCPVAELLFKYADGSIVRRKLHFHREISDWNTQSSGYSCRFAVRGNDSRGVMYGFTVFDWVNPQPEKELTEVVFQAAAGTKADPVLLALSAVGSQKKYAAAEFAAPETVKNAVADSGTELESVELAKFDSGKKGKNKFGCTGKLADRAKWRFVFDETAPTAGRVLEVTVPPSKVLRDRVRVVVDVPVPEMKKIGAMVLDYWVEDNSKFQHSGLYFMHGKTSAYKVAYGAHNPYRNSDRWNRLVIPWRMFSNDGSGKMEMSDVRQIRISFWFRGHKKPVKMRLGHVSISPNDTGYTEPMLSHRIK